MVTLHAVPDKLESGSVVIWSSITSDVVNPLSVSVKQVDKMRLILDLRLVFNYLVQYSVTYDEIDLGKPPRWYK
jgi:hypothetical protein